MPGIRNGTKNVPDKSNNQLTKIMQQKYFSGTVTLTLQSSGANERMSISNRVCMPGNKAQPPTTIMFGNKCGITSDGQLRIESITASGTPIYL